jgi:TRAP-type C4-dicarboxylate transport system substrate-binding protein
MKKGLLIAASALAFTFSASVAQAADKKVNIKLSYWVPPTHLLTPGYKDWAASVEKASGGTITTTLYPTSQLGSGRDHYDMVKRGIAGFGLINPGYTPGRFPVIGASDLPFTNKNSLAGARALTRWYAKYEEKEMPEHYVCHVFTHDIGTVHTTKKPVHVPSDLKGLNIRSANATMSRFMLSVGANPVQVPIMEAKDTLEKGITDGITVTVGGVSMHSTFKFGEVVKYTLDTPLYVSTFEHGITKRLYDGMSAAQRRVIDDHCTPEWSAKVYKYWYEDDISDQADAKANLKDHTFYKPTDAEIALWRKAAEPVVAAWKEDVKKAGYNPDQVLAEMHAELKKEDALF